MPSLRSLTKVLRTADNFQARVLARAFAFRWSKGAKHSLPGQLIVSLTSYPARFAFLHLTLQCLLSQAVRPDRVILWVAYDDMVALPPKVIGLKKFGLEIRGCEDLRSYKKLIPLLREEPEAFIVTADDDVLYRRNWLQRLTGQSDSKTIQCGRARAVKMSDGTPALYADWPAVKNGADFDGPILPIGMGGVLYPPHSLDPRVLDVDTFTDLAPTADDLWFFWMARLAKTPARLVRPFSPLSRPPEARVGSTLMAINLVGGMNDVQIAKLHAAFPHVLPTSS